MIRQKLKFLGFLSVVVLLLLEGLLLSVLFPGAPFLRKKIIAASMKLVAQTILLIFGIKLRIKGEVPPLKGMLSVSNHPSYLDFFVIAVAQGINYVSPIDLTAESRFSNRFVRAIGCILVDRRSRDNQDSETREIRDALEKGIIVHFFPEARTTDGTEILRFRRPLFRPAVELDCPVQMITLNYLSVDGVPLTMANKDAVHWYRQNPLNDHFWRVMTLRRIEVELTFEVRTVQELLATQEHIADAAHDVVEKNYQWYDPL